MDKYREKKRERRIRDRLRMVARGRRYWLETHLPTTWYFYRNEIKFRLHKAEMHGRYFHDHLCICSCDSCGNPRHSGYYKGKDRLTIQERRALINKKEQKNE